MGKDTDGIGYEPRTRDSRAVEDEIGTLSSQVLDMTDTKGQVTKPGPADGACSDDDTTLRRVRHPWSLYGLSDNALRKAMDSLADSLPARGWKVVKDGADSSKNKNREILAVHMATSSQLEVTWMRGLDGHDPLISVDVYSRCFRTEGSGTA
ncbi:hypothetical protein [Streptomyces sp. AcH 505]|uniref:hypothetical protein n=1 Tax=Streptomyces sp. AcH 505 TaxID=352211 RepID=UPI0006946383